ncbi:hypothetical protein [Shewanella fidelis]|uniref:Uncharacterized protein n=1 Tax=Shewanella fidelis TaxID=173509 RepID=A0AAW8NL19_9GAMM|nr:hypothetical protein [Shewanella fidelis]MDR8523465.1 hypothetical protein [Shewanella fidelis]MDW4813302.1 hypothetical protein [Shewanella fidelis]MDW4817327.1 hypothetical protein [Shewanella fidelis]MDW4821317.1 hypothetical protein [Shewanella fidelis]MDW4824605.1 hypothetical protein [Shewanella fidelis]
MTTAMDKDLAAMLAKVKNSPEFNQPMPLVDKALLIVNDASLSFKDKVLQIEVLEEQAKGSGSGFELSAFAEVWESLHALTPLDEDKEPEKG